MAWGFYDIVLVQKMYGDARFQKVSAGVGKYFRFRLPLKIIDKV